MKIGSFCGGVLALAGLLAAATSGAEDWNQWRGPARNGHLVGFRYPAVWPKQLVKKWTLKLGEGHSSPIIVGNRAFTLTRQGEQEVTTCLDLNTGKTLWQERVNAPFDSVIFPARRLGKSPRSTPLYQGGKLYTLGVNGLLTCFQADTGKVLWRRDFAKQFPIPMPICGASLSPLIDGKRLYVHVGHDAQGAFFALDKDTGRELWAWRGEGPGYTSPLLATIGKTRQIVTASHNLWIGLNPDTGALLWSVPVRQNMFNHNSITPVIAGDTILCGGNQRPTFALSVKQAGGRWTTEKLWETRDVTMSTSSPILSGNRLYAVNEKRRGQVVCMSPESGKVLWACPGNKGEQVTLYDAGPYLLAFAMDGDLFVYRKEGDGLTEVARYAVADGAMWASPAVAGNQLLVKGAETLTLWEVPAP
jgi:outer membrane protein assembly factor BamB